ncbi:short-chain dehydrogenase [Colletotrichum plurivorum]|uniref:Short-chain dehydrogenase n=1 Tax=Colletotrichum plurivorum TaxID=2175906 RepID=A0A8H6KJ54_9PEZI|nr:short-chain dehydrogenase [Colletotrichum plurivorum]
METTPPDTQPIEEDWPLRQRPHERGSTHGQLRPSSSQQSLSTLRETEPQDLQSHLHSTQQSRKKTNSLWQYCTLWVWEVLLLCVATAAMAAIVAILLHQDGRPAQDWPFPITLNSTANILSTICRGILVSIAAEIICQSKWVWYWSDETVSRRIIDLQHFDSGSRGLVGAARLAKLVLWHSPTKLLLVFIIVFSFAIGPCIQQAIKTVGIDKADPEGTASIPVSTALSGRNWGAFFSYTKDLNDATESGLSIDFVLHPKLHDWKNCSFTGFQSKTPQFIVGKEVTHASAGICNICTNVTSLIESKADPNGILDTSKTSYELPNGMTLKRADTMKVNYGNLSWATAVMSPEALDVSERALANVTVLSLTSISDAAKNDAKNYPSSVAISCSIFACLRSYSGSVIRGELAETVISTTTMYADIGEREEEEDPVELLRTSLPWIDETYWWNYTALQSPCLVNDETYTVNNMAKGPNLTTMRHVRKATAPDYPSIRAPRQCVYQFDSILANALTVFMHSELFHGECSYGLRTLLDTAIDVEDELFPKCKGNDWISGFWETGNATAESIEHHFLDFTNTFTNELRMGLMPADNGIPVLVRGEAYQMVSFTSIDKQ